VVGGVGREGVGVRSREDGADVAEVWGVERGEHRSVGGAGGERGAGSGSVESGGGGEWGLETDWSRGGREGRSGGRGAGRGRAGQWWGWGGGGRSAGGKEGEGLGGGGGKGWAGGAWREAGCVRGAGAWGEEVAG